MRTFCSAAILPVAIFLVSVPACQSRDAYRPGDNPASDPQLSGETRTDEGDPLYPASEEDYPQYRLSYLEYLFNQTAQTWSLLEGSEIPPDYHSLLESGALPIIPVNPYTGEDIRITRDYSPGDIYLSFPSTEDPAYRLWWHLGEFDRDYNPELASRGEIVPHEYIPEFRTDGRTLYLEYELSPEEMEGMHTAMGLAERREMLNFPGDDEGRIIIYQVCQAVQHLLIDAGNSLPPNSASIDDIIATVGRKNPVSWTNPYTGEPMRNVPWVRLPFYSDNASVPQLSPSPQDKIDKEALAGNYSFVTGRHPNYDEQYDRTAIIQFYFYLPSGEVASYLATGPPVR